MEKQLEDKVIAYLKHRGIIFSDDSVAYRGIRKDIEMFDGSKRDMHVIGYLSCFEQNSDQGRLCYVYANTGTGALEFLITPHTLEEIDEDFQ